MTKTANTKRALLAAVLALVVSISMLVGTTFAWFTDSVTSGRNTIQSGNLDVELYYAAKADAADADWVKVDGKTDIFGYNNWEPGYTKVVYFKVVNNGSLALKYQLTADVYSEKQGTNKAGAKFSLSDYLYSEVVAADATRESILASTTGVNVKDTLAMKDVGYLEKGQSEVIGFAVWMPTSVGNIANHNGDAPEIQLGINLLATQMMSEEDSFGKDYDEDALYSAGNGLYIDKEDGSYVALDTKGLSSVAALASTDASITSVTYVTGGEEVEVPVVRESTAFEAAIDSNNEIVVLTEGEYKMPSLSGGNEVTIVGTKDTVIDVTLGAYMDQSLVAFEGVTIKGSTGMANGNGSDYAALYTPNVTYIDCTFEGPFRVGRDGAKFIGCTFNNLGSDYVWNMSCDTVFDGCTFNSNGKALLLYADGPDSSVMTNVVVKNCTFNATGSLYAGAIRNQPCAAIEIHNYGCGFNLTTSGNTYNTEYFSGEWRIKTYESGNPLYTVTVNGTEYTTTALDGKLMTVTGGVANFN